MTSTAELTVVMMGATGAVGGQTVHTLISMPSLRRLTLLGRRPVEDLDDTRVQQHIVDVLDPSSYRPHLPDHEVAISTLGVGEPSKMSKEHFLRIDRDANADFAKACREAGVRHYELLGSVGSDAGSMSFYLRSKGELEDTIAAMGFERVSVFRPSMILTPTNRYGVSQAMTLAAWPTLSRFMVGSTKKYRGIRVEDLGRAIAVNAQRPAAGFEVLEWPAIMRLAKDEFGDRTV